MGMGRAAMGGARAQNLIILLPAQHNISDQLTDRVRPLSHKYSSRQCVRLVNSESLIV